MSTLVKRLRDASEPGAKPGHADLCESHRQLVREAASEIELLTIQLEACKALAEIANKALERL